MTTETFDWDLLVGASGQVDQRVEENNFGDGYTQAFGSGINNESQAWNVSVTGQLEGHKGIKPIQDFLARHAGWKSFKWRPPGGVEGYFRAVGRNLLTHGGSVFTLSWKMQQVFKP